MKNRDYTSTITAKLPAVAAIGKINRVPEWWASHFDGQSEKLNDVFTIRFGTTWVTFKIIEVVAQQKIVWLVTDCYLHWLSDKTEWKNTKIVWELAPKGDSTQISFTHLGLVPEIECFDDCKIGWDFYIQRSLFQFITENKGLPDQG